MVSSRRKTIIMAFAMTIMMTGLVSVILLGAQPGHAEMTVKEFRIPVAKDAGFTNISLSMASVSSGTLVLFMPVNLGSLITAYGLFIVAIGTVSLDRRNQERNGNLKEQVQDWISENPGIHLRELQRCIGCAMGALQYHIYQLELDGDIVAIKNGNTKHFFNSDFSDDQQVLLLTALMRNPTLRAIVSKCSVSDRITQAELSRTLSMDKSLISYYISHLLEADILDTIRVFGREKPLILNEWASTTIIGLGL